MTGQAVYYIYRDAAIKIGLEKEFHHPHCLRHAIAGHLAMAGLDVLTIQTHLGHLNPQGTLYYMQGAIDPATHNVKLAEASPYIPNF